MRKILLSLTYVIAILLFLMGCIGDVGNEKDNLESIALKEAEKVTAEQGYSILSSEGKDVLIGDSGVFELIKDASIE